MPTWDQVRLVRSDQYRAYQRLRTRYQLIPSGDPAAWLYPVVVPITNMDEALADVVMRRETVAVAGAGTFVAAVIPAGFRFKVYGLRAFQSGGDFDIQALNTDDPLRDTNTGDVQWLNQTAATSMLFQWNTPIPLDEGQRINISVVNFVGAGNLVTDVFAVAEELFR